MTLRAAVVEPVGGHSGMDYYDDGLCRGLEAAQVKTVLYTCDETGILQTASFPVKPYFARIYGQDPAWRRALRYVRGSWRSLYESRRQGRQICHLHFFHVGPLELFNVLLARSLGLKVIVTAHDVNALASGLSIGALVRRAYGLADAIIAHNQVSRRELIASLDVPQEKVAVIPHGNYLRAIDPLPDPREARLALDLAPDVDVLLFFGQIKAVKGLDILLQAMPAIVATRPNIKLVVAGRVWKDAFARYQQLIDQHDLGAYCRLDIDHIPHDRVGDYFGAADLVVLPYRKIYQSGVLLMSMSYGRPVLASDLAGMKEIIDDGETGFLFPSGDAQALAASVTHILSHKQEAARVAARGLALMTEAYGWEHIGRLTADLYRTILRG